MTPLLEISNLSAKVGGKNVLQGLSLSINAGEGGAQGDTPTIRGFSARGDLFVDGARDETPADGGGGAGYCGDGAASGRGV